MVVKALYVGIITCKQLFRFEVRFVCLEFYKNCPRLSEMVDHYQCVLRATRISALCGQLEESPSNTTGVYLQHQFFLEVAFFLPQS